LLRLLLIGVVVHVALVTGATEKRETAEESLAKSEKMISVLREQLEKNKKDIAELERSREAIKSDFLEARREVKEIHEKLVQCELREKNLIASESYMQQEMGNFALEVKRVQSESKKIERELKSCREKVEKKGQTTDCNCAAKTVDSDEIETLKDNILNCEETVKAVRERCDKDQSDLKQLTKEHDRLVKASGNCTEKLKDCETQKAYLEFLKKGYDIVVQDLEKEAKEAIEDKDKSDRDADAAIKGKTLKGVQLLIVY